MSELIYIGNGTALIGVPARDLSELDVDAVAGLFTVEQLIASGLYKRPGDFDKRDAEKVLPHVVKKTKKEEGE